MEKNLGRMNGFKILGALLVGGYLFYCALNTGGWHLIDNVDLIIHEAGHTLAFLFGDFIRILAGSGFQVLVPLLFTGYFYVRNDYFSSNLLLTWVGYNLVNVSVYIDDAIDLQLPLLGGDSVIHDWNYLLSTTGHLYKAHQFAALVNGLGLTIITVSIIFAIYYSRKQEL